MKLAQNEKILKEFCYATSKSGILSRSATEHWIVITDKRILAITKNKDANLVGTNTASSSQEFVIKGIKGVKSIISFKSNFWPIVQIIFGALFTLVLIGIPWLIKGIKKLNQYSVNIQFLHDGFICTPLVISSSRVYVTKRNLDKDIFGIQIEKAKVDKDAVTEIVNEIGAIILENQ